MLSAAMWMDLEIKILSEVKDRYHMMSLTCGILGKKKIKMNLLQNKDRLTDWEDKLMVTRRKNEGEE